MRRVVAMALAGVLFAASSSVVADMHDDEEAIRARVEEMWKEAAEKKYNVEWVNPAGVTQATSAGGFWETLSAGAVVAQINEGPNQLDFTPYYVQVKLLGSKKDVAWVTFYLTGRITLANDDVISDYRTRASIVMEKLDGKWVESGSHYSPLFAGSGVVLD